MVADFVTDDELLVAQERAEALVLLRLSLDALEVRRVAFGVATDELGEALDRATSAREDLVRATDLVANAMRLVALVKGSSL